eukprot:gene18933-25500_t
MPCPYAAPLKMCPYSCRAPHAVPVCLAPHAVPVSRAPHAVPGCRAPLRCARTHAVPLMPCSYAVPFKMSPYSCRAREGEKEAQEDRLNELTMLKQYLLAVVAAVDATVVNMTSAKDRMTKLLTSKDKKQMILDMAAANEIDPPLMDLLQTNVQAAREAGQEDAAKFMEKVMMACAKFFVAPAAPAAEGAPGVGTATTNAILGAKPPPPPQRAAADGNSPASKLIIPGRNNNFPPNPPASPKAPGSGSGLVIDPRMRPS